MLLFIWNFALYQAFTVVKTPIGNCSCKSFRSQSNVWLPVDSWRFGLLCCCKPSCFLATWSLRAETKDLAEYIVLPGTVIWNGTVWLDCITVETCFQVKLISNSFDWCNYIAEDQSDLNWRYVHVLQILARWNLAEPCTSPATCWNRWSASQTAAAHPESTHLQ